MTQEFDPRKSYLTLKANEKMIAFVGFIIRFSENEHGKEGIVKISSFHRPYGGGYLTMTFIIDRAQSDELKDQLNRTFENLTNASLKPYLGKGFERIVKVSLDSLEKLKGWYIEEINVYFRSLEDREKDLIEEKLIPALECLLPCTFDSVEWWPEGRTAVTPGRKDIEGHSSLKSLFNKWFGAG